MSDLFGPSDPICTANRLAIARGKRNNIHKDTNTLSNKLIQIYSFELSRVLAMFSRTLVVVHWEQLNLSFAPNCKPSCYVTLLSTSPFLISVKQHCFPPVSLHLVNSNSSIMAHQAIKLFYFWVDSNKLNSCCHAARQRVSMRVKKHYILLHILPFILSACQISGLDVCVPNLWKADLDFLSRAQMFATFINHNRPLFVTIRVCCE